MGSEWKTVKLGELLTTLTDYHANGSYKVLKQNVTLLDEPNYAIMIRTTNFEKNEFDTSLKYITEDAYNFLKKSQVFEGDIIMNKIANAGSCYYIHDFKQPVSLAMNLFLLRVDPSVASSKYVFFYLKTNEAYVKNFAEGSVTKTITKAAVRNLDITLTPLPEQKAIAHILGTFDDKIELNRRMNATLEGMAQALFKSWFVDFDPVIDNALAAGNPIPDPLAQRAETRRQAIESGTANRVPSALHDTPPTAQAFPASFRFTEELGWIPEGWGVEEFGTLAENIRDGVDPKTVSGDLPYVGLEHIDKKCFSLTRWGIAADVDSQKSYFKSQDFLFGKLRPYFHKICQVNSEGICSTDILVIRQRQQNDAGYVGCQLFEEDFVEYANLRSTGTRMPRASWKDMAMYLIAAPPEQLRTSFNISTKPIRGKCNGAVNANQTLAKLRDVLLPKLISGELRIPQAEKMVEEAVA
jgi:type I restriction enzyme, S subunit